jgi:DNA-directed RNA polymerase I subunit RPA43
VSYSLLIILYWDSFLLFTNTLQITDGTINLQSPDHIGLLLYGTFNASIPSEFIPKDKYEFNPNSSYGRKKQITDDNDQGEGSSAAVSGLLNGEWVLKSTGESIGQEGVIQFEVSE